MTTLAQEMLSPKHTQDAVKNLCNLEEELVKINCAAYISALRTSGFLNEEVIFITFTKTNYFNEVL